MRLGAGWDWLRTVISCGFGIKFVELSISAARELL